MPKTWKKALWLTFFVMLCVWLIVAFVISRQRIQGQSREIMGVRSLFPAGDYARVKDAKNGWQGYGFARNFRFFYRVSTPGQDRPRPSPQARNDFEKLVEENFSRSPLQQDLALFDGGVYVLQKAGKGYRMFCLFFCGNTNYWADMFSPDSLHFSRAAFENFILNLEIDGARTAPAVAGQIRSLHEKISPFFMQTPAQLLGFMAVIFALVMLIAVAVNVFSGSCPRRQDMAPEACSSGATLVVRGVGRRRVSACCLCREGDFLVIYLFRRPFLKIDARSERQNIVWEKNSLCYKHIRVILNDEDFQNWRSRFFI
jgi:hypothetical protein